MKLLDNASGKTLTSD